MMASLRLTPHMPTWLPVRDWGSEDQTLRKMSMAGSISLDTSGKRKPGRVDKFKYDC